MKMSDKIFNVNLDDVVDVTSDANFIWSIANKLRGTYMPDKYGDVVIPMTIIRRFECTLEEGKDKVLNFVEKNPTAPKEVIYKKSGYQFYNLSKFSLKELCNDSEHIAKNFESYIDSFSENVLGICNALKLKDHIKTMDEGGCLYTVVKAFSELDLHPDKVDSIRMGYIFENLIGRFFQNVDAGQYYTGRDIIKTIVSILLAEDSDDIFEENKVVTILDQACGTGGMLSTAYTYIKQLNPSADIYLYGQEYNPVSHSIGLAEMLIKGQDASNFRQADTFKTDCFEGKDMRYVIENPPFGTPWGGANAKEGQEDAVKKESAKGKNSRFPAGLPGTGDGQLLFMQSAIQKLDDQHGRAAIIENGSPLFTGGTSSGESQIRKWMIENDYIEAIIALPTDLFYNTGIQTYIWILSKNKSLKRKDKIQLIDASSYYKKLRKPLGNKRNELSTEDRIAITKLYANFEENEFCQIYDKYEFVYREYTVMQPLQRSYAINQERIDNMLSKGTLNALYDESKVYEFENSETKLSAKDQKKLDTYKFNKPIYDKL